MKIAIVGGGRRGVRLMEILQQHDFYEIDPQVVAVADIDDDAPAMVKARESGIFTTNDYHDLIRRPHIDLIIELTGKQDVFFEILEHKDISMRAVSSRVVKLFWEISRVSTKEKKARQQLKEASAMFHMAINDLIQDDVLVIGHDYRIVDVNKNMLDKLGMRREEVLGQYCHTITHRQDVPCSGKNHPCPLIKTLETQRPFHTTHIHLDKNDRERYYSISTFPLFEEDDIIGAVEISRDITKDINVQKVMMQQEKLASIGRLSAGVAHEINNPLTTILTSAMLLQEDMEEDNPAYQELGIIANETLRCRKIVTSLLNFARQTKPDKKINDLNYVVTECVLLTQKQAAFKDITVESKLDPEIPFLLFDRGQLEQALINLILNAVEATDSGGKITINTVCCDEKQDARISIADSGQGITKADLQRIFDPFFTTKETGTGLGLAITHGIVEQHGGRLTVKSEVGRGTRFDIHLPTHGEHDHDPASGPDSGGG